HAVSDDNNFRQMALAFHNYAASRRGRFPPAAIVDKEGKPLLSWRVAILPYIDEEDLHKEFRLNEAWDSPHNKKLLARMPKSYASPSGKMTEPNATCYQLFTGPGTLYPLESDRNVKFTVANIPDGSGNTIVLAEASKAVPWTKPEDILVD